MESVEAVSETPIVVDRQFGVGVFVGADTKSMDDINTNPGNLYYGGNRRGGRGDSGGGPEGA